MALSKLCVFCGSRPGARPEYVEKARELGVELARRGLTLVYGGASVGTMGVIADAVIDSGGSAIGVIPQRLKDREIAHQRLTELRVVSSMHERKATMEQLADGFIAMPGGFGTFEELLEIVTWAMLGIHAKPIGILNVGGYYDPLRLQIHHGVAEGFVPLDTAAALIFEEDPVRLLDSLAAWRPPSPPAKWITRSET